MRATAPARRRGSGWRPVLWRPGWRGVSVSWAAGPRLFAVAVRVVSSRVSAYPRIVCRVATNTRAMMYYVTVLYFLGEALAGQAADRSPSRARERRSPNPERRKAKGISPCVLYSTPTPPIAINLPFFVISKSFFVSHFNTHQSSHARSFVPFIFLFVFDRRATTCTCAHVSCRNS